MSKKLDHWIVYGLFDPTTGAIRYVGQTSYQLGHRLSRHIYEAKKLRVCDAKREWIYQLAEVGRRPEIRALEIVPTLALACEVESARISQLLADGAVLLNETSGGVGSYGREISESTRELIGKANTGRPGSMRGRNLSAEAKSKISAANRGRANPMKGKKHPPEFGEKLRAIHASRVHPLKGRPRSAETRAKISAAKTGRIRSTSSNLTV